MVAFAVLDALSELDRSHTPDQWRLAASIGIVALASGLFLRRRLPLLVTILMLPLSALHAPSASMLALYTVGRRSTRLRVLLGILLTFGVQYYMFVTVESTSTNPGAHEHLVAGAYILFGSAGPAVLGRAITARQQLRTQIAERARLYQRDRANARSLAAAAERRRLAREMHDVVSHDVGLIVVQAGALRAVSDNPQAREIADRIVPLAMNTLDELREMLATLREGSTGDAVHRLEDTIELVNGFGPAAEVHLACEIDPPVESQELIFRMTQEGLANARKHAPGAGVRVRVVSDTRGTQITVTNEPPELSPLPIPGSGTGLTGLRERVHLLGGTFLAEGTPTGGFTISAILPR